MKDTKSLLADRLKELGCDRIPAWVTPRLLPEVESIVADVTTKADRQIARRIARSVTVKAVAAAFVAGPPATGEGSKGEAVKPTLLPTGFDDLAKLGVKTVVGHPQTTAHEGRQP